MTEYIIGGVYFRLTFPDVNSHYPIVETLIFIGENISPEDKDDDFLYFQFAEDYARFGSVLESDEGDRKVCCVDKNNTSDLIDLEQLIFELKDSESNRMQKIQS